MLFPFQELHDLADARQNFEALQTQLRLYGGNGAPAFIPSGHAVSYYFRYDTPGTSMQRIYVYNGSSWAGIV